MNYFAAVLICAVLLFAPLSATAAFIRPVSATVGVDAFAVNSYIAQGISRSTNANGPLSDGAFALYGLNTADAAGSVNSGGLHASAVVHADVSNAFYSVIARASTALVNPFIVVPQPGFLGTQALIRIPFSFGGTLNLTPSLLGCPTCFASVDASLDVDFLPSGFSFSGASSLGTISNPNSVIGGVTRAGVLEGLVPVNTELYLRAGLSVYGQCQSDPRSCGAAALFGGSLAYTGSSPDAVNIVWGLTPSSISADTPEPASFLLLGAGLFAFVGYRARL